MLRSHIQSVGVFGVMGDGAHNFVTKPPASTPPAMYTHHLRTLQLVAQPAAAFSCPCERVNLNTFSLHVPLLLLPSAPLPAAESCT